jgi:hypothetical protein
MIIAVLIGSDDHSFDVTWRHLLTENADGESTWIDEITRLGLADFHWGGTRRIYGYHSDKPTVDNFVLWLFARAWERFASDTPNEYRSIQRDFSTWANDLRFANVYATLADRAAEALGIEGQASTMDLPALMSRFTFREVNRRIVARLTQGVERRTLLDREVKEMVRRRGAGKTVVPVTFFGVRQVVQQRADMAPGHLRHNLWHIPRLPGPCLRHRLHVLEVPGRPARLVGKLSPQVLGQLRDHRRPPTQPSLALSDVLPDGPVQFDDLHIGCAHSAELCRTNTGLECPDRRWARLI